MKASALITTIGAAATLLALTGCVPNATSEDSAGAITVDSSADSCDVSANTASSGTLRFEVTNSGDQVTEFYLLADDGLRIVGEVENVGPGISRDLVVQAQPGDYFTVCKPGMIGARSPAEAGSPFSTTLSRFSADGPVTPVLSARFMPPKGSGRPAS